MKILFAAAACAALMLSACAPTASLTGAPGQSLANPAVSGKSLDALVVTVDTATLDVEAALKAGVIKGADIAKARGLVDDAHAAVVLARLARAAGNAQGLQAQMDAIVSLVARAEALAHPAPS